MVFPFLFYIKKCEENAMDKYVYEGPVMFFGSCIANRWSGETMAVSEAKAKSNLEYQCKKDLRLNPSANITLPGKINTVI